MMPMGLSWMTKWQRAVPTHPQDDDTCQLNSCGYLLTFASSVHHSVTTTEWVGASIYSERYSNFMLIINQEYFPPEIYYINEL